MTSRPAVRSAADRPGRRAVITGLGVIAPNGVGVDAFWEAVRAGRSGVHTITRFDPALFPTRMAGHVDDFDARAHLAPDQAARLDRTAQFAVAAARMAARDARLPLDTGAADAERAAVMFGTTLGVYDYDYIVARHAPGTGGNGDATATAFAPFPEASADEISAALGFRGPSLTFAETCSSALDAIGHAYKAIRWGEQDVVVAGGAQAPITPPMVSAFCMLRGMSTRNDEPDRACRPFDKDRDGFVMGEGAGMVVVEELESARARGAHVYGEILGYGLSCDGYHMTNPKPDGRDAARAVSLAIRDAGIAPEEIDYVNAHGTSTPMNDKTETLIVKTVLGAHAERIPMSAVKSMIGHLIGAAGSVELIAALLALEHQTLPPTINYQTPDPECDLDYVPNTARPAAIRTILKNSFGFGGKNSALVVRALEA